MTWRDNHVAYCIGMDEMTFGPQVYDCPIWLHIVGHHVMPWTTRCPLQVVHNNRNNNSHYGLLQQKSQS
jgi:hypothetical protein